MDSGVQNQMNVSRPRLCNLESGILVDVVRYAAKAVILSDVVLFCTILCKTTSISSPGRIQKTLGNCDDFVGESHQFLPQLARIQHVSDSHR
jgi:hypothetical protein